MRQEQRRAEAECGPGDQVAGVGVNQPDEAEQERDEHQGEGQHGATLRFCRAVVNCHIFPLDTLYVSGYLRRMAKAVYQKTVRMCRCLHCGHEWQPVRETRPGVCSRCKRANWDTPKPLKARAS